MVASELVTSGVVTSEVIVARGTAVADRAVSAQISARRALSAERVLAAATLFALGTRFSITLGATAGLVASVVFAPLWLRTLSRFRGARLYCGTGLIALASGVMLSQLATADHVALRHNAFATMFLLLELVTGVGVVLWARTLLRPAQVGVFFAAGLILNALMSPGVLGATNPLKFAWLVPLAALILSALNWEHTLGRQLVAVLALAGLAITADARALFGTGMVVAVLLAWQLRPRVRGLGSSWAWTAGMLVALALAAYNLASTLLINGYLGTAAQLRSVQEVQASGSLLLGGRPELSATWALFRHFPGGFGPGVIANPHEINIAKVGMLSINYQPNNGYVDTFMFGSAVELHSALGDLWASFGYGGILFCLTTIVVIIVNLSKVVVYRRGAAVALFFGLWSLWNMLFSPLLSAAPTLLFAVGLLLAEREPAQPEAAAPEASQPEPAQPEADSTSTCALVRRL